MRCFFKVLPLAFIASFGFCGGCQATRTVARQAWGWIPGGHAGGGNAALAEKTVRTQGLAFTRRLQPVPVKLSEARRVEATLRLKNVSARFIHLKFATSQHFDLLVRDTAGNQLVQWSEDRMFEAAPGSVGTNPGEHLEYHAAFSTRDLQPGQRYTVTALVTGRDDLKVELPLVPEE
jgi:hypothetical protein